jgi:hypothetical protein
MQLHRFVKYHCRSCNAQCINDRRDTATKYRECKDCHRLPELDPKPAVELLPSLFWSADLQPEALPFSPHEFMRSSMTEAREYPSRSGPRRNEPQARENTAFLAAPRDSGVRTDGGEDV